MTPDHREETVAPQAPNVAAPWLNARMLVLLLVLIGGAMRLHGLGDKAFWVDELYMLDQSRTLTKIADVCREGNTPPGRHYLVHALMGASQPEARVRLPAALAGIATIPLLFVFVGGIAGARAGICAATILTFSPWHILHSQDGRMYTLFLFFALLALWSCWRAMDTGRKYWWAMLGLAMALGAWVSYFALWTSAIIALFIVMRATWRFTRHRESLAPQAVGLAIAIGVAALAYAPWAPVILRLVFKYHPPAAPAPTGPPVDDGAPINPFLTNYDALYVDEFARKLGTSLTAPSYAILLLFVLGLIVALMRYRRLAALTVLWFGVPVAILMASGSVRHFFPPRYLFFLMIPYFALVGIAIAEYGRLLGRHRASVRNIATAFLLTVLVGTQLRDDMEYFHVEKQDWRAADRFLEAHTRRGEIVLTGQAWTELGVIFYGKSWLGRVDVKPRVYDLIAFEKHLQSRRGTWLVNWGPLIPSVQEIVDRNTTLVRTYPGLQGDIRIYRNQWTVAPEPQPPPVWPRIMGG